MSGDSDRCAKYALRWKSSVTGQEGLSSMPYSADNARAWLANADDFWPEEWVRWIEPLGLSEPS